MSFVHDIIHPERSGSSQRLMYPNLAELQTTSAESGPSSMQSRPSSRQNAYLRHAPWIFIW